MNEIILPIQRITMSKSVMYDETHIMVVCVCQDINVLEMIDRYNKSPDKIEIVVRLKFKEKYVDYEPPVKDVKMMEYLSKLGEDSNGI
jgi:hypothetical protein